MASVVVATVITMVMEAAGGVSSCVCGLVVDTHFTAISPSAVSDTDTIFKVAIMQRCSGFDEKHHISLCMVSCNPKSISIIGV